MSSLTLEVWTESPFTSCLAAYRFLAMMESVSFPLTAGKLSKVLNASLVGNGEVSIERLSSRRCPIGEPCLFLKPKITGPFKSVRGRGCCSHQSRVCHQRLPITFNRRRTQGSLCRNCKDLIASITLERNFFRGKNSSFRPNGEGVSIGPGSIICENVTIGEGTIIYPSSYIGPDVVIGNHCEIHPFVTILCRVEMGNRVRVFSGAVIGSEGFGFLEGDSGFTEMPQIGGVTIEDDVRIGAKCTIDRSTIGNTFIGRGTKIDDQVHIGHNCRIGKNCILCAQVGLAGSSVLKDGVILGGQVGVAGHLTINENVICGGQTGVTRDLEANQKYFQCPATPLTEALRTYQISKKLPEMARKLKNSRKN